MLASIFIIQGLDAVLHPDKKVPAAEPVVRPIAERASFVPDDVEQVVRLNGAVQLVAGSMLALGRVPRLSALAIAASLLPTTYAGHRFWETDDKQERTQQRIHFLKNVSIFGGLLIAAADTGGNPSLAWRGRHAVSSAKRDVALAAKSAKAQARTANTSAKVAKASAKTGAKAGARAGRVASLLPSG
jgi:putative oxidoreductase